MKTKESILKMWDDAEKYPDFKPILEEIITHIELVEHDYKILKLLSDRIIMGGYGMNEKILPDNMINNTLNDWVMEERAKLKINKDYKLLSY